MNVDAERIHGLRSDESDFMNGHLFGSTSCGYPKWQILGNHDVRPRQGTLRQILQSMMWGAHDPRLIRFSTLGEPNGNVTGSKTVAEGARQS